MDELRWRFPLCSQALRLYPAPYRSEYGQQILQTLADMLDGSKSRPERASVWLRAVVDLPVSATKQQLLLAGGIMATIMPDYVKQSAVFGAVMLAPFTIFLFLDSITSHSLYGSFFWRPWVVATWIVFMPAIALFATSIAFGRWIMERRQRQTGFWKSLRNWRENWPMLAIGVLSFGVIILAFGHDSVHCVVRNPIPAIRYWHTTWTCIRNG